MLVAAALLLQPSRWSIRGTVAMQEVVVQYLAPGRRGHDCGLIFAPDNVAAEHISAGGKPNVRVQAGAHYDVVLNRTSIAFSILDAAMQAQIVGDDVKRGTVIEVDVPAVVATPAAVPQDHRLDRIQVGKLRDLLHPRIDLCNFGPPI